MLCFHGRLSLYCFFGTSSLVLLLSATQSFFGVIPNNAGAAFWGPLLYYALINLIIRFVLRGSDYQVAVRATFLGFVFAVSSLVAFCAPISWKPFGIYGVFMALFHYTEFLGIAFCNPDSLSEDSFVLNHSVHYALAAMCSWLEFIVEVIFFPDLKQFYIVWLVGIALCVVGEALRKLAMITASSNFSHLVQYVKRKEHELVTHGIYSKMRHPSYVGWFWWSIGTQIILFNPLCMVIYAIVSWHFFRDRIYFEEITLLQFFGRDYFDYQKKVPTGLPFIHGFIPES